MKLKRVANSSQKVHSATAPKSNAKAAMKNSSRRSGRYSRLWRSVFHPLGGWLLMGLGYLILWQAQG